MYLANEQRYQAMQYRRCGQSGILLPAISLGLWHNFGGVDVFENGRAMVRRAFDLGITHFDLANNYGPPPGSAESNFGEILRLDLKPFRDELMISTKAGWDMWPGPYGNWGSRKYLLASLDQSLERMGLEYVDIFYSHRPDPATPLEETMSALDQVVRSGKALYAGISSYNPAQTREAAKVLGELGTPCLIHQPKYSMFERTVEKGLLDALSEHGIGAIAFLPASPGLADRPLSRRHSCRFARIQAARFSQKTGHRRTPPGPDKSPESISRRARAESCANGVGLGVARWPDYFGAYRRQPRRADRAECCRAQQSCLLAQ